MKMSYTSRYFISQETNGLWVLNKMVIASEDPNVVKMGTFANEISAQIFKARKEWEDAKHQLGLLDMRLKELAALEEEMLG